MVREETVGREETVEREKVLVPLLYPTHVLHPPIHNRTLTHAPKHQTPVLMGEWGLGGGVGRVGKHTGEFVRGIKTVTSVGEFTHQEFVHNKTQR